MLSSVPRRSGVRVGFVPMLTLNGVTISLQNLGTILGVFVQGKAEDVERVYYSFWNHGATSGELELWSDECGLIWLWGDELLSAEDKLFITMQRAALAELLNKGHTKGYDPYPLSCDLAEERISQMDWVTWYQTSKTEEQFDIADSVHAEKGTGNFDDDVVGRAVSREKLNGTVNKRVLASAVAREDDQEVVEEED